MTELALLGGRPVKDTPFRRYESLGKAEEKAVMDVMRSGCLSGFYGSWEEGFLGGPQVQSFEKEWSKAFGVEHTVSVNSATSGLIAAMGAVEIGPGDEVIVPATTMSATAMAPIVYGGIPVFADIDEDTFCIRIDSVEQNLTSRTRALIAVNLFGQAAPLAALRELADSRGLYLIEDNSQSPLATEGGRNCGTIGHIGVFSLNYHKHIHTGEGGMCTTNDPELVSRLQMIRNHAEAVVGPAGVKNLTNMVGFNFRMTELTAAIGRTQLSRIEDHISSRHDFGANLTAGLSELDGIRVPFTRPECRHVYYCWVARVEENILGVSRDTIHLALEAEGVPCFAGYVAPLYKLPIFRHRIAIGSGGFPFNQTQRTYNDGLCPVAEQLHMKEIIGIETCAWNANDTEVDQIIEAFQKVLSHRGRLARWERERQANVA